MALASASPAETPAVAALAVQAAEKVVVAARAAPVVVVAARRPALARA
jgi:hypothetical protein